MLCRKNINYKVSYVWNVISYILFIVMTNRGLDFSVHAKVKTDNYDKIQK